MNSEFGIRNFHPPNRGLGPEAWGLGPEAWGLRAIHPDAGYQMPEANVITLNVRTLERSAHPRIARGVGWELRIEH